MDMAIFVLTGFLKVLFKPLDPDTGRDIREFPKVSYVYMHYKFDITIFDKEMKPTVLKDVKITE